MKLVYKWKSECDRCGSYCVHDTKPRPYNYCPVCASLATVHITKLIEPKKGNEK